MRGIKFFLPLAAVSGLAFLSVFSQNYPGSLEIKVQSFKVSQKQPISPGSVLATCVTENKSESTPHKRHTLIYMSFSDNSLKAVLEHTVVRWEGWKWVEANFFSSTTEDKHCWFSSSGSQDCVISLAPATAVKISVVDEKGNVTVEKVQP